MTQTSARVSPQSQEVRQPLAVRIEGLCHLYDEEVPALRGVDLEVPKNAYLAIVGQNGSGKTTLVKHLNGLLRPTSGRVWVNGIDASSVSTAELARTVGYVFQNPDHQIFCATTRDEIGFGPRNLGLSRIEVAARTDEILESFGLLEYAEVPPAVLGFGLRRKVSVASVLSMRPEVLILDEPTTGLDWRSARDLMARVGRLHARGHTILLITHDMQLVAEYTQYTVILHEGLCLGHGPTRQILSLAQELRTAHLSPPQVTQLAQRLGDIGMSPDILTVPQFCAAWARLVSGAT